MSNSKSKSIRNQSRKGTRKSVMMRSTSIMSSKSKKMEKFGGHQGPEKHFDPSKYRSAGISERDINIFKEVFDLVDPQDLGVILPNDLRIALNHVGVNFQKRDLYHMLCYYDPEETGSIKFEDFLQIANSSMRPCDTDKDYDFKKTFQRISANKKTISREDMQKLFMTHGINFQQKDIDRLFDDCFAPKDKDNVSGSQSPISRRHNRHLEKSSHRSSQREQESQGIDFKTFKKFLVDSVYNKNNARSRSGKSKSGRSMLSSSKFKKQITNKMGG